MIIPGFQRIHVGIVIPGTVEEQSSSFFSVPRFSNFSSAGRVFAAVLPLPLGSGLRQAKQRSERGRSLTNSCKSNCRDETQREREKLLVR
jgi:hypothetical protein